MKVICEWTSCIHNNECNGATGECTCEGEIKLVQVMAQGNTLLICNQYKKCLEDPRD